MNLEETEYIKNKWQGYTEGLNKKYLNDPDNHDGVITHLEPDNLDASKESITMNKASRGDEISSELFHVLKDDAVEVACNMPANLENSSGHRTRKGQFSSLSKEGQSQRMFKLPHNFTNFTCYKGHAQNPPSQASTVHEPRTSRYTSWIEKMQKNQRTNCQHPLDHRKRKRIPAKTFMSASLTMLKSLTVWITTNCGKFLKRWEYQTTLPASWEIGMLQEKTVRTRHGTMTGSKLGKDYIKFIFFTLLI